MPEDENVVKRMALPLKLIDIIYLPKSQERCGGRKSRDIERTHVLLVLKTNGMVTGM